ncbi:MAG: hypothetical protein WA709_36315, partial [Stellaceae bacterium]
IDTLDIVVGASQIEVNLHELMRMLRHIPTNTIATVPANPHRPFSSAELKRRELLLAYLQKASEDELIEEVLLPLFRQLGFTG